MARIVHRIARVILQSNLAYKYISKFKMVFMVNY